MNTISKIKSFVLHHIELSPRETTHCMNKPYVGDLMTELISTNRHHLSFCRWTQRIITPRDYHNFSCTIVSSADDAM
jgi:hypothetical protein